MPGSTSLQRCLGLEHLGCRVTRIATRLEGRRGGLVSRVQRRAFMAGVSLGTHDPLGTNRQVRELAAEIRPDILWLDKALTVQSNTLRTLRRDNPMIKIVGYSPDDMGQRHNRMPAFDGHLADYDVFFTTKSFGVAELRQLGCANPVFVENGFDPVVHRPMLLTAAERDQFGADITFIGTFEQARYQSMKTLAEAGMPVRVWGSGWDGIESAPGLRIEGRALYGDDYARVLSASRINLCFLRKLNRDLQTTRSVEIPACGGFMMAERTSEHLALFKEGEEAEFFETDDELVQKCRWYLDHESERRAVALAGRERCISGGYSNDDRLRWMLTVVDGRA